MHDKVVIVGAGLTGCSTALELARRGIAVCIVDRFPQPICGASLRNEGKIHLGLVYAADESFATAEFQLRGALTFGPLLDRWLGSESSPRLGLSNPFAYLVAPDSLFTPKKLQRHYVKVNGRFGELCEQFKHLHYLGTRPSEIFLGEQPGKIESWYPRDATPTSFMTREVAIDTEALAVLMRTLILREPLITFHGGHKVEAIERSPAGFRLQLSTATKKCDLKCETLVNCAWENRLYFDSQLGLDSPAGHLFRLKYRLNAYLPAHLRNAPSATRVLGPYGDIVIRPAGKTFLSWYPEGLQGWSDEIQPPSSWLPAMSGSLSLDKTREITDRMLAGIAPWFPAAYECPLASVDAGPIVAWGYNDVDKECSGLHRRDIIGSRHLDGYWSVEPGKLTTAPAVGFECAHKISSNFHGADFDNITLSDGLLDSIQRREISGINPPVTGVADLA